jgi:hypothetical protein
MRYCAAILAVVTLAGCTGHWSGAGTAAHKHPPERSVRSCLRAWNGAANDAVRRGTVPPHGPYLLYGQGPGLSPRGGYQAFVALSMVLGALGTNPPPVCYVYFRFPHGDHGGPALVSYPEVDRAAGVYGSPSITTSRNTDVGGRIYVPDRAGRLHPTDRFRPT